MGLTKLERMSAVMLAKTIATSRAMLDIKDESSGYVRRLYKYGIFTVQEVAEIAEMSEYKVRQAISGEEELRAKSGVYTKHLDHVLRMIDSHSFGRKHIKSLVDEGATIGAVSRVTGIPESTLRRWVREGNNE